jgi:hypothetical protein
MILGTVFNSKAVEALGLSPMELAWRVYPLDVQVVNPAIVSEDQPPNATANV